MSNKYTTDQGVVMFEGVPIAKFTDKRRAQDYADKQNNPPKSERDEYWEDVRDMAESIKGELKDRIEDGERGEPLREWLMEHIHESIDGSQRVIYTYQAQMCLVYSQNDGAYFDLLGEDGAVSELAFMAFKADVEKQLDAEGVDLNDPGPTCAECGTREDDAGLIDGRWLCETCKPEVDSETEVSK